MGVEHCGKVRCGGWIYYSGEHRALLSAYNERISLVVGAHLTQHRLHDVPGPFFGVGKLDETRVAVVKGRELIVLNLRPYAVARQVSLEIKTLPVKLAFGRGEVSIWEADGTYSVFDSSGKLPRRD